MNDSEQLLHIMMQMHLPTGKFLTLQELKKETGWSTERLCVTMRNRWFVTRWVPDENGKHGMAYAPSPDAMRFVAMLFYGEAYTPFKLDRDVLTGQKEHPVRPALREAVIQLNSVPLRRIVPRNAQ